MWNGALNLNYQHPKKGISNVVYLLDLYYYLRCWHPKRKRLRKFVNVWYYMIIVITLQLDSECMCVCVSWCRWCALFVAQPSQRKSLSHSVVPPNLSRQHIGTAPTENGYLFIWGASRWTIKLFRRRILFNEFWWHSCVAYISCLSIARWHYYLHSLNVRRAIAEKTMLCAQIWWWENFVSEWNKCAAERDAVVGNGDGELQFEL